MHNPLSQLKHKNEHDRYIIMINKMFINPKMSHDIEMITI